MWHHFALAFCCFTVAVTASERSPAKVRIHHERSTQAELIASVEALGKTHHLKLKRTLMPLVPLHEVRQDDNGTVTIVEIHGNATRNYYEDEETGAFLFMNSDNTLEGMISDSVALHFDNNEHTASEVNEKTGASLCGVSHNEKMNDLPEQIERSRLQIESKAVSYVAEVVVFADTTLSNYLGSRLVDYMQVYWKMVDRRFKTVVGASITIRLSSIRYCESISCDISLMEASEPYISNLDESTYQFARYIASVRTQILPFDIAHLMTKRKFYKLFGNVRDYSYDGQVRDIGYPCYFTSTEAINSGVSEDDGEWGSTMLTAHEIGHNLGAFHDGEGTATACSWNDGYIMSYKRVNHNKFKFSSCSSNAMINVYSRTFAGCLRTLESPTYFPYPNYIAGNLRSLNLQCQWATGYSNAYGNPTVPASSQCFLLSCLYVSGTTTFSWVPGYPALEGTPCSTGGFCKDGYCQASWV